MENKSGIDVCNFIIFFFAEWFPFDESQLGLETQVDQKHLVAQRFWDCPIFVIWPVSEPDQDHLAVTRCPFSDARPSFDTLPLQGPFENLVGVRYHTHKLAPWLQEVADRLDTHPGIVLRLKDVLQRKVVADDIKLYSRRLEHITLEEFSRRVYIDCSIHRLKERLFIRIAHIQPSTDRTPLLKITSSARPYIQDERIPFDAPSDKFTLEVIVQLTQFFH